MSTSTATAYKYSVAGHLSFGAPKFEKAQKSSGFWANRTYRHCIKDNVLIEPAMGSAAFLNETINQLAEAYITRKEQETGNIIGYEDRFNELQKVKMFIADRNVYGIDLNPVAVELAEVSLWLNTIYEGGFVPWFGTQLVNGNSLIGARRQVYSETSLQTSSKGLRWFENAPDRVPLGTARKKRRGNTQIYHFLLGDPGMCSYSDKVIKKLEPDNIKIMKNWNKKFTTPYTDSELETLRQLSSTIDDLWEEQIKLRQTVEAETQDALSVFGHEDTIEDSHTTIRQKDLIFSKLYKSEHMKNAGPYARLKFAMDYWCALWFWPIDKADLLPSRSEFFSDLNWILVGTVSTGKGQASIGYDQLSIFDDDNEELQLIHKINEIQGGSKTQVDLDSLCMLFPRLALVRKIAEQNHFMHWELEFADLFAEKGGFDLVIGNPPWIKVEWKEQAVLADRHPQFAVKKLTAAQTMQRREEALNNEETRKMFFAEYEEQSAQQNFLNSIENYSDLRGQQTNLFKCFLPQAWMFNSDCGVCAFIHPEGVYDDPKGGKLRKRIYPRLRKHFMFANERKLFPEVDHHTTFSLNVYGNPRNVSFDTICNLYDTKSITECYEGDSSLPIPGIKDSEGKWNIQGHPDRVMHIGKKELKLFARLFDGSDIIEEARLPALHARQLIEVLERFAQVNETLGVYKDSIYCTEMWHETNAQKNGTIKRKVRFEQDSSKIIISGPHFHIANPLFKSSRRDCKLNSDYDIVDLLAVNASYQQRINYSPNCSLYEYINRMPTTTWGEKCNAEYSIVVRELFNQSGERTFISAIIPPQFGHINLAFGVCFADRELLINTFSTWISLPFDFFFKATGVARINTNTVLRLSYFKPDKKMILRALLLNSLNDKYKNLWSSAWSEEFRNDSWTKIDDRLQSSTFTSLNHNWTWGTPLRSDYERRQALVELDVLAAIKLKMTLKQLITIYRIQFPVLQSYEADTWYDKTGRIAFTNNRSLNGIGFSRHEWENPGAVRPIQRGAGDWDGIMKNAPSGYIFERSIIDDTMPGGPLERTIRYVAPFDRCNRERDYEIAWGVFYKT